MPDRDRPSQAAPGAAQRPQNLAPVPMYARHHLAPPAPVLARRGYACAVPAIPAEYAAPLTMPLQGAVSGFYIPNTSDRVNAFSRVLRPPGVPCDAVRAVPSRRMRGRPPRICPTAPKGPARRQATFRPHFRAGFRFDFPRGFSGSRSAHMRPIVAGIVAYHSRLIVA